LYVDEILSLSPSQIVGSTMFSDKDDFLTGSFPQFNYVPGVVLIEAMAQCGGAGIKKLGLADGLFGLANIERAEFLKGVAYGELFEMVIENIKVTNRYLKQSGVGYVNSQPCVELTWTCVKLV
jgi:3-hydroxyacyl-[acyl-carrier-protein] dehydratase